jgi:DNA processing protein
VTLDRFHLAPGSARYPERLAAAGWVHPLTVRGQLSTAPAVAVVGARAATGEAMARAHAITKHLATAGVHVVSGGALGIDGAAHRGALAGNGTTTVVLGSGIDVLYPARHARLFEQVVAAGGALVSMFPAGLAPRPGTFLQRNPLISALADLVVVVEADVRSGSLSTAQAARKQQRLVCAWPGSRGTDRLLGQGAAIVESPEDVMDALRGSPRYPLPVVLDATAQAVRDAIAAGARDIDSVVRITGLPVRAVLRALPSIEARLS